MRLAGKRSDLVWLSIRKFDVDLSAYRAIKWLQTDRIWQGDVDPDSHSEWLRQMRTYIDRPIRWTPVAVRLSVCALLQSEVAPLGGLKSLFKRRTRFGVPVEFCISFSIYSCL